MVSCKIMFLTAQLPIPLSAPLLISHCNNDITPWLEDPDRPQADRHQTTGPQPAGQAADAVEGPNKNPTGC